MLDTKFVKFRGGQGGPGRSSKAPRVTLNKNGTIYLNRPAYDALGRPKVVTLYYCREDHTIAIEPTFPPTGETFSMYRKQMGWTINAGTFCRHFAIRVPTTVQFLNPTLNQTGILILNLHDTIIVGGIKRTKSLNSPTTEAVV